jgi:hypothetical protein
MYGASFRAAFNAHSSTRILFCDNDGGAEANALFDSFLKTTNPSPNPGVFPSVEKTTCTSADELRAAVLAHASVLGKSTVVGGVFVPAGFSIEVQGFINGSEAAVKAKLTTVADDGFNPAFVNRAVNPVYAASIARYNAIKTSSFFKLPLEPGIALASATAAGSAARASLLAPAQANVLRLNPVSPIGGLATTLGVIFLFVQAQVSSMMLAPMTMPLFGKIKLRHYINIRRVAGYSMATCFALISASLTSLFGTYNDYINATIWIQLFLSSWLIITTFSLTVSFCQVTFGQHLPRLLLCTAPPSLTRRQVRWHPLPSVYTTPSASPPLSSILLGHACQSFTSLAALCPCPMAWNCSAACCSAPATTSAPTLEY